MANDAWTIKTQNATTITAINHREGWTNEELEFVVAFGGTVSDAELAITMGRTLFAIQTIRHAIRAGRPVGSARVAAGATTYRGWMEGDGDE